LAMQTPAPCDYSRATSVEDAIAQLQALGGNARILAGGYSLIPMMKLRLANPGHVIDINPLEPELSYIRQEGNEIRIGALTRHVMMLESDLLSQTFPDIFREAESVLADPVVRNRGTIGGSLCQADPAEDLSGVIVALKGQAVLRGPGGAERVVGMEEFHFGPYMTAVQPTEMLTEVRIPIPQGSFGGVHEKVERRAGDFAIVAVSVALTLEGGTIKWAGIAGSAVGPTTLHMTRAEEHVVGKQPSEALFQQAGQMAAADSSPNSDGRGPADYKRAVCGVFTERGLGRAAAIALRG
jgi:aerobic carbon-monoxide dehydrogenase medium subunit